MIFCVLQRYNEPMNEIKNDIQLNQRQELKLNPEMLQSIRILQMNATELAEFISEEVLKNPVLEENAAKGDGISSEELETRIEKENLDRRDEYDRFENAGNRSEGLGAGNYEQFVRQEETLQEHLLRQLGSYKLNPNILRACEYLIGNLDGNGYLFLREDEFEEDTGGCAQDLEQALMVIQGMEPVGVGARNLQECLQLQLEGMNLWTSRMKRLVTEMLEDIAANRIGKIASAIGVKKAEAQEMVNVIRRLEPKPGCHFANDGGTPFVVPDVIAERVGAEIQVRLNGKDMQTVHYSPYYRQMYRESNAPEEVRNYLSEQFASAESLIRNIRQRNQTLLKVAKSIVAHQEQFFERGVRMLRPLTMAELAEELEMHESTVSRAVAGKYMQCEDCIFPLKHFFGSGVALRESAEHEEPSEVSGTTVRQMIREWIRTEDSAHPLSDQKIADRLHDRGIQISRRTVAKYRENDGIEAASRRRR